MKKDVKIHVLLIFACLSNQLQAASLLSLSHRQLCNVIPVAPNEAIVPKHCLNATKSLNEFLIFSGGITSKINRIDVDQKTDFAILTTDVVSFEKYYEKSEINLDKSIQIISERRIPEVFQANGTIQKIDSENAIFFHEFNTIDGDSGSPILQDGKLVGMHIGVSSDGKGIALFAKHDQPYNVIPNMYHHQAVPAVIVAAGLWCETNPIPCAAGITGLFALAGSMYNKTSDVVIEYIKQKGGSELLYTKDKLAQCQSEKTAMEKVLEEIKKEQQSSDQPTGSLHVGEYEPIQMSNPGWQSEAENTLLKYGGGGGGAGQRKISIEIGEYDDIPIHTQASPGEEAVGNLAYLTGIAVISAYIDRFGHNPGPLQYKRGMRVAWSGRSFEDIAFYANFSIWPEENPTNCGNVFNCDQEM